MIYNAILYLEDAMSNFKMMLDLFERKGILQYKLTVLPNEHLQIIFILVYINASIEVTNVKHDISNKRSKLKE